MTKWIDWHRLEESIPLDELPAFHRAFLELVQPGEDWQDAFLRKVQGKVQASLKQLAREGRAKEEDGRLLVDVGSIPEGFRKYART